MAYLYGAYGRIGAMKPAAPPAPATSSIPTEASLRLLHPVAAQASEGAVAAFGDALFGFLKHTLAQQNSLSAWHSSYYSYSSVSVENILNATASDNTYGKFNQVRNMLRAQMSPAKSLTPVVDPLAMTSVLAWLTAHGVSAHAARLYQQDSWDISVESAVSKLNVPVRTAQRLIAHAKAYQRAWQATTASKKADAGAGVGADAPAAVPLPPDFERQYDEALCADDRAVLGEEDMWRRRLATEDRSQLALTVHPHPLLVPLFDDFGLPIVVNTALAPMTRILTFHVLSGRVPDHTLGTAGTVSATEFFRNWNLLTGGALRKLDWAHLFVAGGSVLGCLLPGYAPAGDIPGCNGFHESDIDIFVHSCDTDEQANAVIAAGIQVLVAAGYTGDCLISQHSVTVLGVFPQRDVQFILRRYLCPMEVLVGFDIPCCSVGFDGTTVYGTRRAIRALDQRTNIVSMSRRSYTYETRLLKYSERGFAVGLPGFDLSKVSTARLRVRPWVVGAGLPQLLAHHPRFRSVKLPRHFTAELYATVLHRSRLRFLATRDAVPVGRRQSDYSWLPGWVFLTKQGLDAMYPEGRRDIVHIVSELRDGSTVRIAKAGVLFPDGATPSVPLTWLGHNPGRQLLTGSFHPIDRGDWWGWETWSRDIPPGTSLVDLFARAPVSGADIQASPLLTPLVQQQFTPAAGRNLTHALWGRVLSFLLPSAAALASPEFVRLLRCVRKAAPMAEGAPPEHRRLHAWLFNPVPPVVEPPAAPFGGDEHHVHHRFSDFVAACGETATITHAIHAVAARQSGLPPDAFVVTPDTMNALHAAVSLVATKVCAGLGAHRLTRTLLGNAARAVLPGALFTTLWDRVHQDRPPCGWETKSNPVAYYLPSPLMDAYIRQLLNSSDFEVVVPWLVPVELAALLYYFVDVLLRQAAAAAAAHGTRLILGVHLVEGIEAHAGLLEILRGQCVVGGGVVGGMSRVVPAPHPPVDYCQSAEELAAVPTPPSAARLAGVHALLAAAGVGGMVPGTPAAEAFSALGAHITGVITRAAAAGVATTGSNAPPRVGVVHVLDAMEDAMCIGTHCVTGVLGALPTWGHYAEDIPRAFVRGRVGAGASIASAIEPGVTGGVAAPSSLQRPPMAASGDLPEAGQVYVVAPAVLEAMPWLAAHSPVLGAAAAAPIPVDALMPVIASMGYVGDASPAAVHALLSSGGIMVPSETLPEVVLSALFLPKHSFQATVALHAGGAWVDPAAVRVLQTVVEGALLRYAALALEAMHHRAGGDLLPTDLLATLRVAHGVRDVAWMPALAEVLWVGVPPPPPPVPLQDAGPQEATVPSRLPYMDETPDSAKRRLADMEALDIDVSRAFLSLGNRKRVRAHWQVVSGSGGDVGRRTLHDARIVNCLQFAETTLRRVDVQGALQAVLQHRAHVQGRSVQLALLLLERYGRDLATDVRTMMAHRSGEAITKRDVDVVQVLRGVTVPPPRVLHAGPP